MNKKATCFVPHAECSVSSGDCFRVGKCLDQCVVRQRASTEKQLRDLLEQVVRLEARIIALERKG